MSPYVIPILLSPKKDMRVDGYVCRWLRIKKLTIWYKFLIPLLDDMIDNIVFLKIDLCNGYHQIHIRLNDKQKKNYKN